MWSSEMQSGKCEEWLSKTVLVRSHGRDGGGLALDEMGEQRRSGECAGEMEEQECSHPGPPPSAHSPGDGCHNNNSLVSG